MDIATEMPNRYTPIIFITAYPQEDLYQKVRQLRPTAYLVKPFDKITLQNAIDRAFDYGTKTEKQDQIFYHIRNKGK